jgi:hypothetical protein
MRVKRGSLVASVQIVADGEGSVLRAGTGYRPRWPIGPA